MRISHNLVRRGLLLGGLCLLGWYAIELWKLPQKPLVEKVLSRAKEMKAFREYVGENGMWNWDLTFTTKGAHFSLISGQVSGTRGTAEVYGKVHRGDLDDRFTIQSIHLFASGNCTVLRGEQERVCDDKRLRKKDREGEGLLLW